MEPLYLGADGNPPELPKSPTPDNLEEKPMEEKPVEEKPVEEKPVAEKPVESKESIEQPAEVKPEAPLPEKPTAEKSDVKPAEPSDIEIKLASYTTVTAVSVEVTPKVEENATSAPTVGSETSSNISADTRNTDVLTSQSEVKITPADSASDAAVVKTESTEMVQPVSTDIKAESAPEQTRASIDQPITAASEAAPVPATSEVKPIESLVTASTEAPASATTLSSQ